MNQILLPANDLKQILPGFNKVISRKATLPVLQCIRLTRGSEGRVILSGTDLDTFASYNLEQPQPGQPFDIVLPLEQLVKTAKDADGDVVVAQESKLKAKFKYTVAGSELSQTVDTLKIDDFPAVPIVAGTSSKMPDNFGECLRQAFETSSSNDSRYVLQGAYLDVEEPNCHSIVSTNGSALFTANTFTFDLKQSVNVSRQKFLEWPGFLTGECEMAVKSDKTMSGWVKLTTPRWECVVKQIIGIFPKWRQVVPTETEKWTKIQLSPDAIKQMLSLSSKLPGDDNDNRTLQLRAANGLFLEGKNKEDKEFTSAEIADVKVYGKSVTASLNRGYLQTALRCGLNEIRINNEMEPMVFLRSGKRLVVMPVYPRNAQTQSTTPKSEASSTPATIEAQPEHKTVMPSTKTETANPAPEPLSLIEQIEGIKDACKTVIRDLTALADAVKQAERGQRQTEKEVETARATLKKLQQVTI